eukprot:SAG22_NODE_1724_length_3717_cov_18.364842_4_plen_126_part_00
MPCPPALSPIQFETGRKECCRAAFCAPRSSFSPPPGRESFGDLQALTTLDLYDNELGTLPESFGDLQALTSLDLRYNHLSTLPESFGDLQALTSLDLRSNQLSTLPESFGARCRLRVACQMGRNG